MGPRFTTLLLALLILATVGVVLRQWFEDPAAPAPGPAVAAPPPAPEPAPANPDLPAPASATDAAPAGPRVWIEVKELGCYAPPRDLAVVVQRGDEVVPAAVEWLGGVGGPWPEPDVRAGRALVRIAVGNQHLHRLVDVRAGSAGSVQLGAEVLLQGRVVDTDGKAVEGAWIWCGGERDDVTATDADGRFVARVPAGDGIPVVVRAPGLAWHHRFVAARGDGDTELFVLARGCALDVQVQGAVDALPGTTVQPVPLEPWTTELLQFPFFAVPLLAATTVDERGQVTIDGLPRTAHVGVVASGPRVRTSAPAAVELARARAQVAVPVTTGPLQRSAVVDEHEQAVAATFWCLQRGRAPRPHDDDRWLLPAGAGATGAVIGASEADGAFAFAQAVERPVDLFVHARQHASLLLPLPAPLQLVLPVWRDEPAELVVEPPRGGVAWSVRIEPFADAFRTVPADQPFVQALPAPLLAELRVRVASGAADWSPPAVSVRPLVGRVVVATAGGR